MATRLHRLYFIIFFVYLNLYESNAGKNILSRRKRYLVFPEGTTWSIAICLTAQSMIYKNNAIWTEGLNWGIAYNLPQNISFYDQFKGSKHVIQRRSRTEFYENIEKILNSMGLDGKSCIYKALCEASRKVHLTGNSLYESILRLIFIYPINVSSWEPDNHRSLEEAYRLGLENKNELCSVMFPNCEFSLLDLALHSFIPK